MSMKKAMKVSVMVPAPDQSSGKGSLTSSEWSHEAVSCLLETYSEKFFAGRGYLRNTDWEEVVDGVNELCGSDGFRYSKTLKQCRDKVDSLKRRYKIEKKKAAEGSSAPILWPYFCRLDDIMVSVSNLKQPSTSERVLFPFPSPLSSSSALPLSSSASPLPSLQAGGYRHDGSSSGGGSRVSNGGKAQRIKHGGGGDGGGGWKSLPLPRVSPPLNSNFKNYINNDDNNDEDEDDDEDDDEAAAEHLRRNGLEFSEEDINGEGEEEEEDDEEDDGDDRGNDGNDREEANEEWNEVESFRQNPRYYGKPATTTMNSSSSSSSDEEAIFHTSVRNPYPNHNTYPNPNPNPKAKPNPNPNPRYGRTRTLESIDPHGREMGAESGRLNRKRKPSNPASPDHEHCPVMPLSNDVPGFAHVFARIEFAKKEIFAKMELEMAKLRKRRGKRLVAAAAASTSTSGSK